MAPFIDIYFGYTVTDVTVQGSTVLDPAGEWSADVDLESGQVLVLRDEKPRHYLTAHVSRGCLPNLWAALVETVSLGQVNPNRIEYYHPKELYTQSDQSEAEVLGEARAARDRALEPVRNRGLDALRPRVNLSERGHFVYDAPAGWQVFVGLNGDCTFDRYSGVISRGASCDRWGSGLGPDDYELALDPILKRIEKLGALPLYFLDAQELETRWHWKSLLRNRVLKAVPAEKVQDEPTFRNTFSQLMTTGYSWLDFELEGVLNGHWMVSFRHPPAPCGCEPANVRVKSQISIRVVNEHPELNWIID